MAVTFIPGTRASYVCLSTDLSGSLPVDRMAWVGADVFVSDTGDQYRIDENLYLVPFTHPISGSINIDNFPNTFSGSITNFPNTYSGSITNFPTTFSGSITNLPETYSGSITNLPDIQPISGSINILNYPSTYSGSITNVISASFVEGGSSVFVENFVTDGSTVWVDNIVSASFVEGGSSIWVEGGSGQQVTVSGSINTVLYTASGCPIDSHEEADGGHHLGVSITQAAISDPNNSSDVNLDASGSYTFIGTATSTLGVVGLQWSLKTDQNATIYIEQSPDGTEWDISYSYDYITSRGGQGETIQATQSYWRIRVVLTGTVDTTYFRLQGVLCPIATPLPSSLSADSRLKVETTIVGQQNPERHAWINSLGDQMIAPRYRIAGTAFDGTSKDTMFWSETGTLNSGSVTNEGGYISLKTSVASNGIAVYSSVRKARFVAGSPTSFTAAASFHTTLTEDNVRRIGAYDDNEGFFFELDGSTFSVGSRTGGIDTPISSGSFNGSMGNRFTPTAGTVYKFDIEYLPVGVFWYINNTLLHKSVTPYLVKTLTLGIRAECINDGSTTDVAFRVLGMFIARLGQLNTAPASYYFASGQTAGVNLKTGAGNVHSMVFGSAANNAVVTLIDNTSGSLPVLWEYDATGALAVPIDVNFSGMPFYTGLRLIVKTGNASFTTIYE